MNRTKYGQTGRQHRQTTKKKRVQRFVTVRAPPGRRDLTPWNKGRDGGGLRRRIKEWMWDGDRGRRRAGRQADNPGVGSGGVRTPGRRTTNRVQGWDDGVRSQGGSDGGRSQGEDRQEQEEPGGTQATITMVAHGGADRGRSHGGGMAADYRGRPMAAEQVEVEPEAATESRRARMKPRIRRAKAELEASATEV